MSTTYEEQRTEQEKAIDAEVLGRVKRGLAWLEETHGPGWEDKIDLATLNLRDGSACVLGQVYAGQGEPDENGFTYGLELLYENDALAFDEAFAIEQAFNDCEGSDNWDALQAAWEHVLLPRVTAS